MGKLNEPQSTRSVPGFGFHQNALWRLMLWMLALLIAGMLGYVIWATTALPQLQDIPNRLNPPSIRITDRYGQLLYEAFPPEGGRHTAVPIERIPLQLQLATVATEDRSFYENPGLEPLAILRSAWINLRGGQTLTGGSTITQQVARTLLMSPAERTERSLKRKLREAVLALRINQKFTKDEILAFYLNQTYYGRLAYGVEAASQTYFGKPVEMLDLAESALLAGLPQAPSPYDPFINLQAAKQRQQVVLDLMVEQGSITAKEAELAYRESLVLAGDPYPMQAPHFVMMVRSQLDQIFTPELLWTGGGWTVKTTLDLNSQHLAEKAVIDQLANLRAQPGDPFGHNVNSAALTALNPLTGEILAMVGSPDYFDAQQAGAVNMALAARQPGSALKPLIYAAAFDPSRPEPWTAGTMILDVTTHFTTLGGKTYTPVNYDGLEHGPILARTALASSLNIPAVLTLEHVGVQAFYSFASQLGISTLRDPSSADLSAALGGGEVQLLELTTAYGVFANGGHRVTPFAIQSITDNQGAEVYSHPAQPSERVLDERIAWLITDILRDDAARLIGFGRNSILRMDRPVAVKTGTTTNFHDNWTVGYTPSLVVGVWVGNTSHQAMHNITGLTGAAPIWAQMMRSALAGQPPEDFFQPPGLLQVEICALSGSIPTQDCPNRRLEWFIAGTEPTEQDTMHRPVEVNTATGQLAALDTPQELRRTINTLDLPPAADNWARSNNLTLYRDVIGPPQGMSLQSSSNPTLKMILPAPNAVFVTSTKIPPQSQQIKLQAAADTPLKQVFFWVDGKNIAEVDVPPYQAWWQLTPGQHQAWSTALTAEEQPLESDQITFEVR